MISKVPWQAMETSGKLRRRENKLVQLLRLGFLTSLCLLPFSPATDGAFVIPRRVTAAVTAAVVAGKPIEALAELSPPLEKFVTRYAEQIQGAMDFLYFDIKPLDEGIFDICADV